MTYILSSSIPPDLEIKIWGFNDSNIYFNGNPVSIKRFLSFTEKVLTAMDLTSDDLRVDFIEYAKTLMPGPGYNISHDSDSQRLVSEKESLWPEEKHRPGIPIISQWGCMFSMIDFLFTAAYVLTNTDLMSKNDPRLAFLERLKTIQMVDGQQPGGKRYSYPS